MKQPLVLRKHRPRASRHGKVQVTPEERYQLIKAGKWDHETMAVRKDNVQRVADGPTTKRGRLNVPPTQARKHAPDIYQNEPGWWKEVE